MAKLVIQTQYKENYAWNEDGSLGTGADAYWKFKGGDTYVVENLTTAQINKIAQEGIPTLSALIEYSNEAAMEYILDWSIEEDDAEVCQAWETPIVCVWKGDRWIFTQNQINGEFGYMRKEIASVFSSWIPTERDRYFDMKKVYTMEDGAELSHKQLTEFLEAS